MSTRIRILTAVAFTCMATAPAHAAGMMFGGEVYGAFNTHSMTEPNKVADDWRGYLSTVGISSDLKHISKGFTGGLALRVWPSSNFLISAGWEPLFVSTEETRSTQYDTGVQSGDALVRLKLNFDANDFSLSGAYFIPTQGSSKFGFGGGVDFVQVKGEYAERFILTPPVGNQSDPDNPYVNFEGTGKFTGSGEWLTININVGFHVNALGEWTVSPGFGVTAAAGYRMAKVTDTKLNDISGDPKFKTDYSGFIGRAGLVFYLPTSGQ